MLTYRCSHRFSFFPDEEKTSRNWCMDCRHEMIGREIRVARFGRPIAVSSNWSGDSNVISGEAGMSCYAIEGNEIIGLRWEFAERTLWIGTARVVGWGADEEPLVELSSARLRRATRRERERLGVASV